MKIDLHCHTKQIKTGDGSGRNVSVEKFKEKISNADIRIVAITNHNAFDLAQYNEFNESVKDFCQVWPGIEIDVLEDNLNKYHLLVIANPKNTVMFSKIVCKTFKDLDLDKCTLKFDEVFEKFQKCDVLYIPHYSKDPGISDKEFTKILETVGDSSRVFCEPQNNKSLGVFANFNYNVIIGSDVKNWEEYETNTFAELRLPVDSFEQFCMLSKRDFTIVETLLNMTNKHSLVARPHKKVKFELSFYDEMNIIFGQKGTGKSEIIRSLYEDMISKGFSCEMYTGSERTDDFNALTKTNDMTRNINMFPDLSLCKQELDYIKSWKDCNVTPLSDYIEWFETKDNNRNKRKMKITECNSLIMPSEDKLNSAKEKMQNIDDIDNKIIKINIENYLNNQESVMLNKLINKLKKIIFNEKFDEYSELESINLTNFSIEKVKELADKNTNSKSKPSSTGFFNLAKSRIGLEKSIKTILSSVNGQICTQKHFLGKLEGKGNVYIQETYRMYCSNSRSQEFGLKITPIKSIIEKCNQILNEIYKQNVSLIVCDLTEILEENNIDTIEPFIGLSKQIINEQEEVYEPSSGEKGILLLQKILSRDAYAYFLDEPELGMGNSYVDSVIRPKLSSLAKKKKMVVVATHNANIAVRTLPYLSVFRSHENGEYKTYIGNPFTDLLKNINNPNDNLSWSKESMHTLEGGPEAFYNRKEIYESRN